MFDRLIRDTKSFAVNGTKSSIGFAVAGVGGNFAEAAFNSTTGNTNPWLSAGVNLLSKVLGYAFLDKNVSSKIADGVETNGMTDLYLRLLGGGGAPTQATLLGYNILGSMKSLTGMAPSRMDGPIGFNQPGLAPPGPYTERRERNYGHMPWTPDVMERQRNYATMPGMPYQTRGEIQERQTRYGAASEGFSQYASESPMFRMFGMH